MKLKDKLFSSYLEFENKVNLNSYIHQIRLNALENFKKSGFPTTKLEAWKYTSLKNIINKDYSIFSNINKSIELNNIKQFLIKNIDSYNFVFIDGNFNSRLSNISFNTNNICLLSEAFNDKKHKNVIKKYFNNIAKQDNLTSLNTAFTRDGVFIHIPKNVQIEKPIQILFLSTGIENKTFFQPRNLIITESNAHVKIIERHQCLNDSIVLTNSVTEIYTNSYSTIDYYKIQNDNNNVSLIDNTYFEQKDNSICSVHSFCFGGNLIRNNLNFYQKGEHINSILKGITILEEKQHVDHYTLVHHIEPNCESHQDYKGIYDDNSIGVFNGKVIVEKEAQKTNAYQQNNNVLISNSATVNSKPQLEIFADDVRCSHGCTIGQLDNQALFYIQQRGIPIKKAKALLMFAFANTVLESVKIHEVKKLITKLIANKLKVDITIDL